MNGAKETDAKCYDGKFGRCTTDRYNSAETQII